MKSSQANSSTLFQKKETIALTMTISSSLEDASMMLEAAGISGLCHPTSNEFEPHFPRCSSSHRFLYDEESPPSFSDDEWFFIKNILCAILCVCVAAWASGLTMGLLSLDPLLLVTKMRRVGCSERELKQAASLLPIVNQHHLLLVTLLLLNSIAAEALPIFLDNIFPTHLAVIIAVLGLVFFGEIIPSAVFTGPNKMTIAAAMVPLVRVAMVIFWPIAFPIAKVLDHILHEGGTEESTYTPPDYELQTRGTL